MVDVEQRMLWGLPAEYSTRLKASLLIGKINTSFVERVNLTIWQSVSKLTRRTWGSAQFTPEMSDHLYWWLAYYHFSRYHQSLRIRLEAPLLRTGKQRPRQYRRRTPAVAAGLTHQRLSVMERSVFRCHKCKTRGNKGRSGQLYARVGADSALVSAQRPFFTQKRASVDAFQLSTTDCGCTDHCLTKQRKLLQALCFISIVQARAQVNLQR